MIQYQIHPTLFKCLGMCTVHTYTHTRIHACDTRTHTPEMLVAVVTTIFFSLSYSGGEHSPWLYCSLVKKCP